MQFEKPQQPLRFFFYIKKPDVFYVRLSCELAISAELDEILAKSSSFADEESVHAVNVRDNSAEAVRQAAAFVRLFMIYLLW